jgi:hypothetical protein
LPVLGETIERQENPVIYGTKRTFQAIITPLWAKEVANWLG